MTDKENIAALITGLSEYYTPGQSISPVALDIYLTALKLYPYEKIKVAAEKLILESKFMPKVSEIIEYINGGNKSCDLLSANAERAWSLVLAVVRECGGYKSFTLIDKAARKALEMTGYNEILMCENKDLHWKKRDFIESYKVWSAFLICGQELDAPDYFIGSIELSNSTTGYLDDEGRSENDGVYIGRTVYIAEAKEYKSVEAIKSIMDKERQRLILRGDGKND